MNTGTKTPDGKLQATNSRKLLWDEENRLLALSDNGFVSNYWYDAAGERSVKESGGSEGVSVNGVLSGARTETTKFTAYISPYMVVNNGGYYSKHIYIGSQRIVSELGSSDIFAASPLTTAKAGSKDFTAKYADLTGKIKSRYDSLGVTYRGTDNAGAGMITSTAGMITTPVEYYFHSDHLGSSSLITDGSGDVVQHLEYIPFGEVFVDERHSTWSSPYKFNAKELDEETGLYYYGARYYDPRTSVWISSDPLKEKYPNISSYVYCADNPVNVIDPDGKRLFFVGGANNDKDGWNYINRWGNAFTNSGVSGFTRLNESRGKLADIEFTSNYRNSGKEIYFKGVTTGLGTRQVQNEVIDNTVSQIKSNLKNHPLKDGEQLNMGGYSYGSVLQAQAALKLANDTHVDNVILIGSPISTDSELYKQLLDNKNIGNIIRFDIPGDKLSNPKDIIEYIQGAIQNRNSNGPHFSLARPGANVDKAIKAVTNWINSQGVK